MGHLEHKHKAPENAKCAVITVSDSRTPENDDSGKLIIKLLEDNSHEVIYYCVVKDDVKHIRKEIETLRDDGKAQVVVLNGGTGVSSRDRTPEAVEPLMDRKINGFGEIFRHLSYKDIGSPALLSRAAAGVVGNMITFLLPGSPEAAELAMKKLILPEITHLVFEVQR
jgi:molybdenum cofactor biosynthesis protein B